ncbi:MAG: AI-2E family transporter [Rickettsiales bacterium]
MQPMTTPTPKSSWQARWFNLAMWAVLLTLLLVFLRAVEPILLPFVLGIFVAYLVDPLAMMLARLRVNRTAAAGLLTVSLFTGLTLLAIWLVPLLYDQLTQLMSKAPQLLHQAELALRDKGAPVLEGLNRLTGGDDPGAIPPDASELVQRALLSLSVFARSVLASGAALINIAALLLITPIVCFYMIRDWPVLVQKIDRLLPVAYAPTIREQLYLINRTLSAYMRGQLTVMFILSIFYVLAFVLAGLNFGLVLGILAGCIVIIPYIGSLISVALGLTVAYGQFTTGHDFWIIVGIYGFGQILESQILTPKIIGDKIGLHPAWLLFGILAGGVLLGFTGVLLAVPLTAVIGVLVKFAVSRYLQSGLYLQP